MENTERITQFSEAIKSIKEQLRRDIVGQDEVVENIIIAIIDILC